MSQQTPKPLSGWMGILTSVTPIQENGSHHFSNPLNSWCKEGVDLLWIRNATLVLHAHIAIATANLFLFQMAILRSHPSHMTMSTRFIEEGLHRERIDVHAKYDQKRRGREGQVGTCLPAGPQPSQPSFLGKRWLTAKNIAHSFTEVFLLARA